MKLNIQATTKVQVVLLSERQLLLYIGHLNKCLTCSLPVSFNNVTLKASQLIVQLICSDKHKTTWRSHPLVQLYSKGNLSLVVAVQ